MVRVGRVSRVLVALAACAPISLRAQNTGFEEAAVSDRLPALMDSAGIPGLAVAVLRDGRVTWTSGAGTRRAGTREAVDENTVFEAASLSKPVFAYVVLKLVDQGRLDLDRPLADYLPLQGLRDPRAARITARMVLSHTTGLPNELHPGDSLALAFDPGSSFRYSGEGYAYLQQVVEHETGQSLERLAKTLVFDPLGMTRSSFVWEDRFGSNAAVGHGGGRIPRAPGRPAAARAPSSLHTSVSDYARFAAAVLTGEGLLDATARDMGRAQSRMASRIPWGLGWALDADEPRPALWHWGDNSNTGFTAFVMLSPARRSGVIWLANSVTGLSIAGPLLDVTLPGPHFPLDSLGYERYDDPRRVVREQIDAVAAAHGATAALAEYERLHTRLPADRFDERLWNVLGYRMLERGRPSEAKVLFQANAALYPQSANVHDSLGEALAALGDREGAIASYRRSLQLDPANRNASEWLRRLGAAP